MGLGLLELRKEEVKTINKINLEYTLQKPFR